MQTIHRQASNSNFTYSATSTPSTSPQSSHLEDRLNALLANFDSGTHAFCREDRPGSLSMATKVSQATAAAAAQQKALQQQQDQPRRPSLISLLSLARPTGHFDPSREPKLHGLP